MITRSPTHTVWLYKAAVLYCRDFTARLHQDNCKALKAAPQHFHPTYLVDNIEILAPHTLITILAVPIGTVI